VQRKKLRAFALAIAMPPSLDFPEAYFEIIFNILAAQNKRMLTEIAIRYEIPISTVLRDFVPTRKGLRAFLRNQSSSSSSSSSG
jgi:hypothetical protein